MDAENYLKRLRDIDIRINALISERKSLSDILIKTSTWTDDKVTSTPTEDVGDYILKRLEKREQQEKDIDKKIDELVDFKREASDMIDRLENSHHQAVLKHYYINGVKTWEEVAEIMNYNTRHVHRFHRQALKEFEKILKSPR